MASKTPQADKNQLFELVDHAIKNGLSPENLKQLTSLANKQESAGPLFDLPETQEYILKRFINACMSTDSTIRDHSSQALQKWAQLSDLKPNLQKTARYIIDVSNYKKGGNRKSQSDAFAAGRVLVVRSLAPLLKNNTLIFDSISQILAEFRHLEQQAIEACHLISSDKVFKLKFHSLSPKTESSRFLYKLFLQTKDPNSDPVKIDSISEIIESETENYPKKSTVLYNVGKYLHTLTDSPTEYFRQYANKFLDNDSENEADIHEIYSVLTVLQGFLDNNTITEENYQSFFDKKIISVWLEQYRVLNKKMKALAKSMSIKIEENPGLAYQVLVDLHEEGIYLDNISSNHPFAKLYEWVDVSKFWKYLYGLCLESDRQARSRQQTTRNQDTPQSDRKQHGKKQSLEDEGEELQEEQPKTFYNQLQYFIKLRLKELPGECICSTIVLLLNGYRRDEKQKEQLYLCINLFNLICRTQRRGKNKQKKLNKKMLIILNGLKFEQLQGLTPEQVTDLEKSLVWVKKATLKLRKDETCQPQSGEIDFFNFYNCMVYFCLIYPEETETCKELQLVYKGLLQFYGRKAQQASGQPRKRVKREKGEQDEDKPIHVLTDIFMSLMTKPPAFLRKSIHNLFDNIIPYLNKADIDNMLAVITTPDADFIEQI